MSHTSSTDNQSLGFFSKHWKDLLKLFLSLGLGVFLVYWFLLKLSADEKQAIWNNVVESNYWWILAAILVNTLSLFLRALRWQLLFRPMQIKPGLNNTFGSVIIAYFANLLFPRLGEVLRCGTMLTSERIPIEKTAGTVLTERIVDLLAFAILSLIGIAVMFSQLKGSFGDDFDKIPILIALIFFLIVFMIAFIWAYRRFHSSLMKFKLFAKIDTFLSGCMDGVRSIFQLKAKGTLLFIIYSVLIYLCYLVGSMLVFQAFPPTAGLGFNAAFVVYIFGTIGIILTNGGLGSYPPLVQTALLLYSIPKEAGLACGWVMWSATQILTIVLGLAYTVYFSIAKKKASPSLNTNS